MGKDKEAKASKRDSSKKSSGAAGGAAVAAPTNSVFANLLRAAAASVAASRAAAAAPPPAGAPAQPLVEPTSTSPTSTPAAAVVQLSSALASSSSLAAAPITCCNLPTAAPEERKVPPPPPAVAAFAAAASPITSHDPDATAPTIDGDGGGGSQQVSPLSSFLFAPPLAVAPQPAAELKRDQAVSVEQQESTLGWEACPPSLAEGLTSGSHHLHDHHHLPASPPLPPPAFPDTGFRPPTLFTMDMPFLVSCKAEQRVEKDNARPHTLPPPPLATTTSSQQRQQQQSKETSLLGERFREVLPPTHPLFLAAVDWCGVAQRVEAEAVAGGGMKGEEEGLGGEADTTTTAIPLLQPSFSQQPIGGNCGHKNGSNAAKKSHLSGGGGGMMSQCLADRLYQVALDATVCFNKTLALPKLTGAKRDRDDVLFGSSSDCGGITAAVPSSGGGGGQLPGSESNTQPPFAQHHPQQDFLPPDVERKVIINPEDITFNNPEHFDSAPSSNVPLALLFGCGPSLTSSGQTSRSGSNSFSYNHSPPSSLPTAVVSDVFTRVLQSAVSVPEMGSETFVCNDLLLSITQRKSSCAAKEEEEEEEMGKTQSFSCENGNAQQVRVPKTHRYATFLVPSTPSIKAERDEDGGGGANSSVVSDAELRRMALGKLQQQQQQRAEAADGTNNNNCYFADSTTTRNVASFQGWSSSPSGKPHQYVHEDENARRARMRQQDPDPEWCIVGVVKRRVQLNTPASYTFSPSSLELPNKRSVSFPPVSFLPPSGRNHHPIYYSYSPPYFVPSSAVSTNYFKAETGAPRPLTGPDSLLSDLLSAPPSSSPSRRVITTTTTNSDRDSFSSTNGTRNNTSVSSERKKKKKDGGGGGIVATAVSSASTPGTAAADASIRERESRNGSNSSEAIHFIQVPANAASVPTGPTASSMKTILRRTSEVDRDVVRRLLSRMEPNTVRVLSAQMYSTGALVSMHVAKQALNCVTYAFLNGAFRSIRFPFGVDPRNNAAMYAPYQQISLRVVRFSEAGYLLDQLCNNLPYVKEAAIIGAKKLAGEFCTRAASYLRDTESAAATPPASSAPRGVRLAHTHLVAVRSLREKSIGILNSFIQTNNAVMLRDIEGCHKAGGAPSGGGRRTDSSPEILADFVINCIHFKCTRLCDITHGSWGISQIVGDLPVSKTAAPNPYGYYNFAAYTQIQDEFDSELFTFLKEYVAPASEALVAARGGGGASSLYLPATTDTSNINNLPSVSSTLGVGGVEGSAVEGIYGDGSEVGDEDEDLMDRESIDGAAVDGDGALSGMEEGSDEEQEDDDFDDDGDPHHHAVGDLMMMVGDEEEEEDGFQSREEDDEGSEGGGMMR